MSTKRFPCTSHENEDIDKYEDIFSVLLPERFIRLTYVAPSAPVLNGCLQRVDPFTVSPSRPAPESFTASVDFRRFPANVVSKLLYIL